MVISRDGTCLIHFGIVRGQFTLMCGLWLFKGISWQKWLVTRDQGESSIFSFQQELLWRYQIQCKTGFPLSSLNQGAFRPTQTATSSALYNKQNDLDTEVTRLWRSLSIEGHHCEADLPDMENDLTTKHSILTTRV